SDRLVLRPKHENQGGGSMRRYACVIALSIVAGPAPAPAAEQPHATGPGVQLNDTQKTGRLLYEQSCGVGHTKPTLIARLYGPLLSQNSLGGKEDVMREVINNGTPRMPGFKHHFKPEQIDAIVSFIKTMPVPPPEASKPEVDPQRAPRAPE